MKLPGASMKEQKTDRVHRI